MTGSWERHYAAWEATGRNTTPHPSARGYSLMAGELAVESPEELIGRVRDLYVRGIIAIEDFEAAVAVALNRAARRTGESYA